MTVACDRKTKQELYFGQFLEKYKEVELPLVVRACNVNTDGLERYSDIDTLYMRQGTIPYCRFKTNGDYVAVISLGMADCLLPVLTTWTKDGKQIDQQDIAIGYCGSGPGFECDEFMTLDKYFTLYTSDTISSVDIDSLGQEIQETKKKYVYYRKGRLLNSGKIELSDTVRQNLGK